MKKKDYRKQKIIAWFFVIFYSVFGLYMYFSNGARLYENLFIVIFFLIVIFNMKRFKWSSSIIILMGLVPLLHTVATIPFFVDGEEYSIYNSQFNYQFDFITHVAGFFVVSVISLQMINWKKKVKISFLIILFLALIGSGTLFELNEFYGYYVFGFGKGAFHFGEGDNSTNFGPWGDSMTDAVGNILGIVLGYVLHFGSIYIKKRWYLRKQ